MAVYRFRVAFEDNEDITRDIEIRANQNFADFHKAIQEAIKFDNKLAASFFVSDDYWRKDQEVTLLEEDLDTDVKLMSKTKISSLIENPYQRFIYVYDKTVQWTLLVELIKIIAEDPKTKYPVCSKTMGTAPKQYKLIKPVEEDVLTPEATMAKMLEEAEGEDDEAYKHAHEETHDVEEEDIKLMEGQEGDEEEAEEGEEHEEGDHFDQNEEHEEH